MNVKVIAISGPSCSGKSTLARHLRAVLPHLTLIYEDDFYLPTNDIPVEANGLKNWDTPAAFDFGKLKETLLHIREHNGHPPPQFTSIEVENERGEELLSADELTVLREKYAIECPVHVVVVDGLMLYHKDSSLWNLFDVKILFGGNYAELKRRRGAREGYVTSDGYWVDPPGYFDKIVWPQFVHAYGYLYLGPQELSPAAMAHGIKMPPQNCSMRELIEWTISRIEDS